MRLALLAVTEELRRLRNSGVRSVAVGDATLAVLRERLAALPKVALPAPEVAAPVPLPRPVVPAAPRAYEPPPFTSRPAPVTTAASSPLLPPPAVSLPPGDKAVRWQALLEAVRQDPVCRAQLRPGKQVVLGTGSLDARIFFVGEAPGAEEELKGEPFVGPAGQLLTRMIGGMGLRREEVYIGNIMNWRPQLPTVDGVEQVGNRAPTEDEIRYCLPYLQAQIDIVRPALLVALGSTAAKGLLGFGAFKALSEVRSRWLAFGETPLMVTYHPSYILRNQSNRSKREIWEDLLQVMEKAGLPISDRQRGHYLDK